MTIHGKVATDADRTRAEQPVRQVAGVKKLVAIEGAYSVAGVRHVASEIETVDN